MFGGVPGDDNVIHSLILLNGLKFNSGAYIKCLEEEVLISIKRVTAERHLVWQQHPVLCRRRQYSMWEHFCDHINLIIWLPYSPDCGPLDNYVWGAAKRETYKIQYNTKFDLMARITAAFSILNQEILGKGCRIFRCYLLAVSEANGDFFE